MTQGGPLTYFILLLSMQSEAVSLAFLKITMEDLNGPDSQWGPLEECTVGPQTLSSCPSSGLAGRTKHIKPRTVCVAGQEGLLSLGKETQTFQPVMHWDVEAAYSEALVWAAFSSLSLHFLLLSVGLQSLSWLNSVGKHVFREDLALSPLMRNPGP